MYYKNNMLIKDTCNINVSRSIIDKSRSINDTFRVIRIRTVRDTPSCGFILTAVEVSFTIIIYL